MRISCCISFSDSSSTSIRFFSIPPRVILPDDLPGRPIRSLLPVAFDSHEVLYLTLIFAMERSRFPLLNPPEGDSSGETCVRAPNKLSKLHLGPPRAHFGIHNLPSFLLLWAKSSEDQEEPKPWDESFRSWSGKLLLLLGIDGAIVVRQSPDRPCRGPLARRSRVRERKMCCVPLHLDIFEMHQLNRPMLFILINRFSQLNQSLGAFFGELRGEKQQPIDLGQQAQ